MTPRHGNPGAAGGRSGAEAKDEITDSGANTTKPRRAKGGTPQARWRERHPLEVWAHAATRSAIRRGLLTRQPCEVCGAEPADAHHEDHTAPLAIRFLCRRHHSRLRAATRRAGK